MILLNGKETAKRLEKELKSRIDYWIEKGYRKPVLAILELGENPASSVYVRNKIRSGERLGIETIHRVFEPSKKGVDELHESIMAMSCDCNVDGILVQLPFPKEFKKDEEIQLDFIPPFKDVDGFTTESAGRLWKGEGGSIPATPKGIIRLLKEYGYTLDGKRVCIVGRSNIVGKPLAALCLQENATVTICHTHTEQLQTITNNSDIVVLATGQAKMFGPQYFSYGGKKIIVDVGMNRDENGKLCGDADFEALKDQPYIEAITPVPGGVGPMTVYEMNENLVELYELVYCQFHSQH